MYKSHWDVRTEGYNATCKYYNISSEILKVCMWGYLGSLNTKMILKFTEMNPGSQESVIKQAEPVTLTTTWADRRAIMCKEG